MKHFAFVDPSGGANDSMCLAISRTPLLGKKAVLCCAHERKAPFNPDDVTAEFCGILKDYNLTTCTGDRYSAQWVVERFRAHGVRYLTSERTKSEIFLEFLALTNADRVRIPRNARLRAQLQSLERRTSRSGRDSVDHSIGAHDDLANVVAGCLCLAAAEPRRKFQVPYVFEVRVGSSLSGRALSPPPEFVDTHKGVDLSDPFQGDERFWRKL